MGKNYTTADIGAFTGLQAENRTELGGELGLTGCEISLNSYPAGKGGAFLHAHKLNEEVYIIVRGSGTFKVDGDEFPVQEGSVIRVSPAGQRALKAGGEGLVYLCVQAQQNSLTQATMADGILLEGDVNWS